MSQVREIVRTEIMRTLSDKLSMEEVATVACAVDAAFAAAQNGQGDAPASLGPCSISESQHPTRSTDNASGKLPAEQRGALSKQDEELWDLLFPEGTHTEQLPVDWGRWLDAYTEENDTLLK